MIPRGTRFGPFEGTRTPNKPNDKVSWRYYWRVSQITVFSYLLPNILTLAFTHIALCLLLSLVEAFMCKY